MDFKVGDLVVLKSGGPPMTVTYIHGNGGTHYCLWFKGHEVEGSDFPPEALAPAPGTVKESCLKIHSDACSCDPCLDACRRRLEVMERKENEEHRDDH